MGFDASKLDGPTLSTIGDVCVRAERLSLEFVAEAGTPLLAA